MITNATYVPPVWSPAYNPIVYNFLSNENQQPDFFYVIELWVQEGSVAPVAPAYTLYQRPSPSGYGMVDISTIMQGFLNLANWTGGEGYSTQYRDFGPQGGFTDAQAICSVYLKIGERYVSNGILTDFNGIGGTGAPQYDLYSKFGSEPTRVIPASLNYEDSVEHLAATGAYGYFEPYIMDGNGKFLTRMPSTQNIATGQTQTLSFLNWNVRNWGTKWDVAVRHGDDYPETELMEEDKTFLAYRFNTAWSPPIEAITKLSEQYPDLDFELSYEEETGWGGLLQFEAGNINEIETYENKCRDCDSNNTMEYCENDCGEICSECNYMGEADLDCVAECDTHKVYLDDDHVPDYRKENA